MSRSVAALALLLAGCGYQPPSPAARAAPLYEADLAACRDSVPSAINKQNAKTGLAWLSSPVRRWGQISDGVQGCMADKGYGRLRWCTAEELQHGGPVGGVVATSAGLQCVDPARPRV